MVPPKEIAPLAPLVLMVVKAPPLRVEGIEAAMLNEFAVNVERAEPKETVEVEGVEEVMATLPVVVKGELKLIAKLPLPEPLAQLLKATFPLPEKLEAKWTPSLFAPAPPTQELKVISELVPGVHVLVFTETPYEL